MINYQCNEVTPREISMKFYLLVIMHSNDDLMVLRPIGNNGLQLMIPIFNECYSSIKIKMNNIILSLFQRRSSRKIYAQMDNTSKKYL